MQRWLTIKLTQKERCLILIGSFTVLVGILYWIQFSSNALPLPEPFVGDLPSARPPVDMEIFKIPTGVNHRSAAFAYRGGSILDKRDFSMMAVLVKHPRGDLLIDTGFGRNIKSYFKTMPAYFRITTDFDPGRSAADQLNDVGYDRRALKAILITHAHWDHVSGIPDFPGTPILITDEEHKYIINGGWITSLMRNFQNVNYEEYRFESGPYLGFPKSHDVYGDGSIVVVPSPGHTPGSVSIFITLPTGKRFAMIGDLAWQREGVLEREERPLIQRTLGDDRSDQVREGLLRMAAIARRFPEIIIVPAHDVRGFEFMPLLAKDRSHVGWARCCAHADSSFWNSHLCHVIAAQRLQAQAISLRWSLTQGISGAVLAFKHPILNFAHGKTTQPGRLNQMN